MIDQQNLLPSILQDTIKSIARLPGIGKKSALRIALHLYQDEASKIHELLQNIHKLTHDLKTCTKCGSISEENLCKICAHPSRVQSCICVVEQVKDVISIESTMQYNGTYHLLNGLIAPLEGIGPDKLNIPSLMERIEQDNINEIILALSPNSEGDTTAYYLAKLLKKYPHIIITSIARGVSFGTELEYSDEYTLGKAIEKRVPLEKNFM